MAKKSLPSRPFQAAGCEAPLQSGRFMPSAVPKETDVTRARFPAMTSESPRLLTQKMPLLQLIQSRWFASSRIAKTSSSKRPWLVEPPLAVRGR